MSLDHLICLQGMVRETNARKYPSVCDMRFFSFPLKTETFAGLPDETETFAGLPDETETFAGLPDFFHVQHTKAGKIRQLATKYAN
jgi:hypothetical protein